jgi:hypothetical protein
MHIYILRLNLHKYLRSIRFNLTSFVCIYYTHHTQSKNNLCTKPKIIVYIYIQSFIEINHHHMRERLKND